MSAFLDALNQRVLVCDGAMGTVLYAKGIFLNRCFDELNLTRPDLVAEIHRDYAAAGADVLETNTFGANRFKLEQFGLVDALTRINAEGARLARRAADGRAWVAGSVGPLGVRVEPWGRTGLDEAAAAFAEQAEALASGGADLFILETFTDVNELATAVRAIRAVSTLPIVAQLTTGEDGHTLDGTPPDRFTAELERAGADVIGLNCSVGPAAMLETIEAMAHVTSAPLSAQPNAGLPRAVDGRNLYLSSPEYMASYARRFVNVGVRLVGGCCGTTPGHTRQIADAVRTLSPAARTRPAAPAGDQPPRSRPVARREKSRMARALADAEFVVLAEIATPRGVDLGPALAVARRFKDLGVGAVNVPDYPQSGARASALAVSALIEQGQVETLLQYTCRDRSLIGMQSDLVGAHAMGVRNVLLTTGSPARVSSYADATSVYEVDAIGLINMVARLNQGQDIAGQPIGAPTQFHIGAAINPFAADQDAEWRRLALKIDAGAEFVVTPPVLDVEAFEAKLGDIRRAGVPVIAAVPALDGLRHAEFLASEVVGVRVAEGVLDRLRRAADEADEALAIVVEIAVRLRTLVAGLQVTTFHGSPQTAERLLNEVGRLRHA
ncbi:MAG: bifunctional homocysteine S-methyltransferase/methylenetetrahydrofolate reductase [Acidobacteria bacterium]|nr:bifunctional homocysteine S-methyltransferase/methylenetetrahydrofolate reductase [Acidobacteriota bacterium]